MIIDHIFQLSTPTPPPPPPNNDRVCDHKVMLAFPQEKISHYTTGDPRWCKNKHSPPPPLPQPENHKIFTSLYGGPFATFCQYFHYVFLPMGVSFTMWGPLSTFFSMWGGGFFALIIGLFMGLSSSPPPPHTQKFQRAPMHQNNICI